MSEFLTIEELKAMKKNTESALNEQLKKDKIERLKGTSNRAKSIFVIRNAINKLIEEEKTK